MSSKCVTAFLISCMKGFLVHLSIFFFFYLSELKIDFRTKNFDLRIAGRRCFVSDRPKTPTIINKCR